MVYVLKWQLFFIISLSSFCDGHNKVEKKIKLYMKRNGIYMECNASEQLYLEVGDQFRVYVNKENGIETYGRPRCQYPLGSNIYSPTNFSSGYRSNILVSDTLDVPDDMTHGDWYFECVFYTKYSDCNNSKGRTCHVTGKTDDKGIGCIIKVHIRDSGKSVMPQLDYLSVNNEMFTPSFEVQEYKFYDGEATNFICHKKSRSVISEVMLTHKYTTRGNIKTRSLKRPDNATIYMKLTANNDGETMECAIEDLNNPVQIIKLKLIVRKDTRGMLTVEVNGLTLPRTKEVDNYYYHEYMYNIDERLTVAVIKDDEMYGDETCSVGNKNAVKTKTYVESQKKQIYSYSFSFNETKSMFFYCELWKKEFKVHIIVKFLHSTVNYSPYITGLSMSNVLLQYSNATSNVIHYVIGNETLYLLCSVDNYEEVNWIYSDTEVKSRFLHYTWSFQLLPGRTNANIQCKVDVNPKITYLELVRGNDVEKTNPIVFSTSKARPTTEKTILDTTISRTTTEAPSSSPSTGMSKGSIWSIILTVMLLVFLAAIGLWKVFNNKKKRLLEINSSNMDYQNLPEHHEGPMNTPSQWNRPDDVIYAEPNSFDNLYAKPIPKSKRNATEPTYAEPEHYTYPNNHQINNETAYAAVQNNIPTYANQNAINYHNRSTSKVEHTYASDNIKTTNGNKTKDSDSPHGKVPKSHNENKEGQNSSDLAYAELYHRTAKVNFEPTTRVYSTVEPQRTYVNLMAEFRDKNPGYVNAHVKNSVEPAYCEIIKPKK